mgnify:CR=1 FL=1
MGYGKVSIGIVLVLAGIWSLLPKNLFGLGMWQDLLLLLKGVVPLLIILVGGLIVWIELEDIKYKKPKTPVKPPEVPKPTAGAMQQPPKPTQ